MTERRTKELFLDALELPEPERAAFVARACGNDARRAEAVRALLAADARAGRLGDAALADPLRFEGLLASPRRPELGPGDALGAYVVRRKLGEGGFGIVWLAEQLAPVHREVALKVLKAGMDTAAVLARFEAERHALARMDHPGICKVHDAGTTPDGRPYFAMELFEGQPITRYCEAQRLDLDARLRLFAAVCEAVQHAHHKGVIHRDLKPSNVLVREIDGRPTPKVIDFGVAKAIDGSFADTPSLTREGQCLGTPAYMSPEQAACSGDVDTRSDVHALGALLYELLCGAPPFDAETTPLPETLRRIRQDDPRRPSRVARVQPGRGVRSIPADLDWVVMRCLEKDRERRYASAYGLRADVQRFLAHRPVEAVPPSFAYKLRKLARRHRVLVGASAAILLALVIGSVGVGLALREATRQARISEEVIAFLNQDLLGAVGPSDEPGRGPSVSMRAVLDEAARRIERSAQPGGRFAREPLVEAAIRDAIGGSYRELGLFREAEPHLRRALELRESELGGEHPSTLLSTVQLANVLRRTERIDESEELLARFTELESGTVVAARHDELAALGQIALLRQSQGRHAEAVVLFERAFERARAVLGDEEPTTRTLCNGFGVSLAALGRFDEAELHFRACHAQAVRTEGADHPDSLAAAVNLGAFLLERQSLAAAALVLEPAVEAHRRVYGPEHPQTAEALIDLGILLRGLGRLDESAAALEEASAVLERELGEGDPSALLATTQLARTMLALGADEEAETLVLLARERAALSLTEDHPFHSSIRKDLADIWYAKPARAAELGELLEDDLDASLRAQGPEHPSTLRAMVNLALFLRREGRTSEAEELLREALALSETSLGPAHSDTLLTVADLANVLSDTGRHEEALALAESAARTGEESLDPGSEALALLRLRLGACLLELERFDEAVAPLQSAHEVLARQRHPEDRLVTGAASLLSRARTATEVLAEAAEQQGR